MEKTFGLINMFGFVAGNGNDSNDIMFRSDVVVNDFEFIFTVGVVKSSKTSNILCTKRVTDAKGRPE